MIHHELLHDQEILVITPEGPLQPSDFEKLTKFIDPLIISEGKLQALLIDTKSFSGWTDIGALMANMKFVLDYHQHVAKIAAVTYSGLNIRFLTFLTDIISCFIRPKVRIFDDSEKKSALKWLLEPQENKAQEAPTSPTISNMIVQTLIYLNMIVMLSVLAQGGFRNAAISYFYFSVSIILLLSLNDILKSILLKPIVRIIAIVVAILWLRFIIIGSYSFPIDFITIMGAAVITLFSFKKTSSWLPPKLPTITIPNDITLGRCVGFVFLAWFFLSVTDYFQKESIISHNIVTTPQSKEGIRLGLSLSGGGYRAALYHAGVLNALDSIGVPIQVMSSVSGGSIIGSFYARGGNPEDFLEAIKNKRFNLYRELVRLDNAIELLGSITLPFSQYLFSQDIRLFPWLHTDRTLIQASQLDRVFLKDIHLTDGSVSGRPELMICTTDIHGNQLIGFMPHGVVRQRINTPVERLPYFNQINFNQSAIVNYDDIQSIGLPKDLHLATIVAASGAFPLALPAIDIEGISNNSKDGSSTLRYSLSDGGVVDNLGIVLAYAALEQAKSSRKDSPLANWDINSLIISDGSAIQLQKDINGGIDEFVRAMDVMSSNGSIRENLAGLDEMNKPGLSLILLSPRSISKPESALRKDENPVLLNTEGEIPGIPIDKLQIDTLEFIINNMNPEEKTKASTLMSLLHQSRVITEKGWISNLDVKNNTSIKELRSILNAELGRRLKAFIDTSTLVDRIDPETATSIYRLGQYMVYLNKEYLTKMITFPDPIYADSVN